MMKSKVNMQKDTNIILDESTAPLRSGGAKSSCFFRARAALHDAAWLVGLWIARLLFAALIAFLLGVVLHMALASQGVDLGG